MIREALNALPFLAAGVALWWLALALLAGAAASAGVTASVTAAARTIASSASHASITNGETTKSHEKAPL